jgi:L-ascorbate metabolism protein UlaG (beta-lactamase superfamily)
MADLLRLRADASLSVSYMDRSPFGSPVSTRLDDLTKVLFRPLWTWVEAGEFDHALLPALSKRVRASPLMAKVASPAGSGWRLREELRRPPAELARPSVLAVGDQFRARLPATHWADAHRAIAALCGPGLDDVAALHPDIQTLIAALQRADLAVPGADPRERARADRADVTFVGHNTVLVCDGATSIIIDPFLAAESANHPGGYQPLQVDELGPLDAVLVTHSHPDHFDPASLLRIPPDTLVCVPEVAAENTLTVDMARRLTELGFTQVRTLRWGDALTVGTLEVQALPFFGEQPTDGDRLHPEIRNEGCVYRVQAPEWSGVFLADSGADLAGDVKQLASRSRAEHGPVDLVFCGYRGWLTYPPQLLGSSVARYLLFVPPEQWSVRMRLMNSIDDAIDVAERWGARILVPYGGGGAPWHWRIGLGPRLDGEGVEDSSFDPFPERVAEAATRRSGTVDGRRVRSPVEVVILRPGEGLRSVAGSPVLVRLPRHVWPYPAEVS